MVKKRLMLGAAFAALGLIQVTATPALATDVDLDISAEWDQELDVELEWNADVDKYLDIDGDIFIDGNVTADALSYATLKDDQIIDGNSVQFEDYQNANLDDGTGAEPGVGAGSDAGDFEEVGLPAPAIYSNTVVVGDGTLSGASGNVGLNVAAGDYNLQENAAVLASAEGTIPARDETVTESELETESFDSTTTTTTTDGTNPSVTVTTEFSSSSTFTDDETETFTSTAYISGGAEAGSFSLQNLYDNSFNADETSFEDENTVITNSVNIGSGTLDGADGNIGVNAAAGAFNIQKNALVIASITGGNLAEAIASTLQDIESNDSVHENVTNDIAVGAVLIGASGNIGVNIAAGVGNLQLNSLTIASALLPAGDGGGPLPTDTGSVPGGTE